MIAGARCQSFRSGSHGRLYVSQPFRLCKEPCKAGVSEYGPVRAGLVESCVPPRQMAEGLVNHDGRACGEALPAGARFLTLRSADCIECVGQCGAKKTDLPNGPPQLVVSSVAPLR